MRPELEKYQEADLYLQGDLNESQMADFQARMEADSDMAQFVNEQAQLNELISGAELWDLQSQMQQDLKDWSLDEKGGSNNGKWIAGGLIAAAIAGGALFMLDDHETTQVANTTANEIKIEATKGVAPVAMDSVKQPVQQIPVLNEVTPLDIETTGKHKDPVVKPAEANSESDVTSSPVVTSDPDLADEVIAACELTVSTLPTTTPSCDKYPTGSIDLSSLVVTGSDDIEVQIMNEQGLEVATSDLAAGNYFLAIGDGSGCEVMETVTLTSEECPVDFRFAPNSEQFWTPEFKISGPGNIQILSTSYEVVFSADFEQIEDINWDGKDELGNVLASDYYRIVIQTSSANIKGSVTITPN